MGPARRRTIARGLAVALGIATSIQGASEARAEVEVGTSEVTFEWQASSGPVAGYSVHVARSGGEWSVQPVRVVPPDQLRVSLDGSAGETLRVRVRAFDSQFNTGPWSAGSEVVRFASAPSQDDGGAAGGGSAGGGEVAGSSGSASGSTGSGSGSASSGSTGSGSGAQAGAGEGDAAEDVAEPEAGGIEAAVVPFQVLGGSPARLRVGAPGGPGPVTEVSLGAPQNVDAGALRVRQAVRCDLDGDGRSEYVLGFQKGGGGWLAVRAGREEGYRSLRWVQIDWAWYNLSHGETRPACGDTDGDGRDELVVGLGPGANGWMLAFDDLSRGLRPLVIAGEGHWFKTDWEGYNASNGSTEPAMGDVDGDGRDEVVVGLGSGANGWLMVLDDFDADFGRMPGRSWVQVEWSSYNAANGETRPAVGDLDSDGRDEIAVGLGKGGGSYVTVYDDASTGFHLFSPGWVRSGWDGYHQADGSTRPVVADVDADGRGELAIRLGDAARGWVHVMDDDRSGFAPREGLAGSNAAGWLQVPGDALALAR